MMTSEQMQMFVEQPQLDRGQFEQPLLYIVDQVEAGRIEIPHFQRRPDAWKKEKQAAWFETVKSGDAIGVIVTYQLREPTAGNHYPVWLADGYQRLTATISVMKQPQKYGFQFDSQQARIFVERFRIVTQHRIYDSHEQAYIAFQNLNRGTAATPAEFYKGELTRLESGLHVYDDVPIIVSRSIRHFTRNAEAKNRSTIGKHTRVNLALFYQYVTNSNATFLWGCNKQSINLDEDDPIERHLAEWVSVNSPESINEKLRAFRLYVDSLSATLHKSLVDFKGMGSTMSVGLCHCLLQLGVWRRNVGLSVDWYEQSLNIIFRHAKNQTTTLLIIDSVNPEASDKWVLNTGNLGKTLSFLSKCGMEVQPNTRMRKPAAPGYDNSHQLPFSTHGEGVSFPEPSLKNRARGKNPAT